jgi:hypothetical protein
MATKNLTQAEKQQAAFEENQRVLSLMQEEMWDLLKKVTTEHVGGVHQQLDMIEEAAELAKKIRTVMHAENAMTEFRMKRLRFRMETAKEETEKTNA